jgi:hypothetical protein
MVQNIEKTIATLFPSDAARPCGLAQINYRRYASTKLEAPPGTPMTLLLNAADGTPKWEG